MEYSALVFDDCKEVEDTYDKLLATLDNEKLPKEDIPLLQEAIKRYQKWIFDLNESKKLGTPENVLKTMVKLFNEYKFFMK